MSNTDISEIPLEFTFRGNVHKQVKKSLNAYIYSVTREGNRMDYEVFKRNVTNRYDFKEKKVLDQLVSTYPTDKAFGITAYAINSLDRAISKMEWIEEQVELSTINNSNI